MIAWDDIIFAMNIILTNMTNTVPTNMANTLSINVSTNYDGKKVRYNMDCYILHSFLSVIILLFVIAIFYYYYAKHRSKLKNVMCC